MTPEEERLFVKMLNLLKRALPYIIAHWERSRTGFGKEAQKLMNEIKEILGIR